MVVLNADASGSVRVVTTDRASLRTLCAPGVMGRPPGVAALRVVTAPPCVLSAMADATELRRRPYIKRASSGVAEAASETGRARGVPDITRTGVLCVCCSNAPSERLVAGVPSVLSAAANLDVRGVASAEPAANEVSIGTPVARANADAGLDTEPGAVAETKGDRPPGGVGGLLGVMDSTDAYGLVTVIGCVTVGQGNSDICIRKRGGGGG